MEKITFQIPDTNETVEFFVVEQTRINGINYLLVAEEEEGDCDAFLMKDVSSDSDAQACYEMVEDPEELDYMSKIFASLLEDVELTY